MAGIEINLPFKSPYHWQTIIRFYQTHSIPELDRVTASSFERVFDIENRIGIVRVETVAGLAQLKVRIAPDEPGIRLEVGAHDPDRGVSAGGCRGGGDHGPRCGKGR
jgi:hypothetical protein